MAFAQRARAMKKAPSPLQEEEDEEEDEDEEEEARAGPSPPAKKSTSPTPLPARARTHLSPPQVGHEEAAEPGATPAMSTFEFITEEGKHEEGLDEAPVDEEEGRPHVRQVANSASSMPADGAAAAAEPIEPQSLPVAVTVDTSGVPIAAPILASAGGADDDDNDDGDDGTNEDDSNVDENGKTTRDWRRRLLLGTVGILLLAALTAGLSVGLTTSSNGPETLPIDSRCRDVYDAFVGCSGGSSRASGCGSCIASYYSSALQLNLSDVYSSSCRFIDNVTCDAFTISCSALCDGCARELVSYIECASRCSTSGATCTEGTTEVPTASPGPTTTPSPTFSGTQKCPGESDAFSRCADQNGTGAECKYCVAERLSAGVVDACPETLVCGMMDGCPLCGDCDDAFLVYQNCIYAGTCPVFSCASPTLRPSYAPQNTGT